MPQDLSSFEDSAIMRNIESAIEIGEQLHDRGWDYYIPHLTAIQHYLICKLRPAYEPPYERWLAYDYNIIGRCDAVFRMGGDSLGADMEVEYAESIGVPVYTIEDMERM